MPLPSPIFSGKQLLCNSFPIIVGMVIVTLCNLIDRLFIGSKEDVAILAGMALTLPFIVLITAIGTLIGGGAATRISVWLKENNSERARQVLGNAFIMTCVLSVVLIMLIMGFMKELLWLFGGREDSIPYAVQYLSIIIPGCIFTNICISFVNCMRVSGFQKKSTRIMWTGIIVNIIANLILVVFLDYHIRGAALATVFSMFICTLLVVHHFTTSTGTLYFTRSCFRLKFNIIRNITLTGMTPFFMNLTTSTVCIIMNNYLIIHGGSHAVGAYGIISCYTILTMMILSGLCQGMNPLIEGCYENKDWAGSRKILGSTIRIATLFMTAVFIFSELFATYMVECFTTSPELIALSRTGIRITYVMLFLSGFQTVTANFFQSIQRPAHAVFMNMSRQFIFLIPTLYLFSKMWGITGIWIAIPFADFMAAALSGFFLWKLLKKVSLSTAISH